MEEQDDPRVKLLPAAENVRERNPGRVWTCNLCSQTRNPEDTDKCKTCARPRGHKPEKYNERLREIRRLGSYEDYDQYGGGGEEESFWSDSWGLFLGLILLVV